MLPWFFIVLDELFPFWHIWSTRHLSLVKLPPAHPTILRILQVGNQRPLSRWRYSTDFGLLLSSLWLYLRVGTFLVTFFAAIVSQWCCWHWHLGHKDYRHVTTFGIYRVAGFGTLGAGGGEKGSWSAGISAVTRIVGFQATPLQPQQRSGAGSDPAILWTPPPVGVPSHPPLGIDMRSSPASWAEGQSWVTDVLLVVDRRKRQREHLNHWYSFHSYI